LTKKIVFNKIEALREKRTKFFSTRFLIMKKRMYFLCICLGFMISFVLCFPVNTLAYNAKLAWDPNEEPDLEGYKLYSRRGDPCPPYNNIDTYQESDLSDPFNPMVEVADLEREVTYYFVVTAFDTDALESGYSNIVWVKNEEWGNAQCSVSNTVNNPVTESGGGGSGGGGGGGACFISTAAYLPRVPLKILTVLLFLGFFIKGIEEMRKRGSQP
jgi:hypothetical protein